MAAEIKKYYLKIYHDIKKFFFHHALNFANQNKTNPELTTRTKKLYCNVKN